MGEICEKEVYVMRDMKKCLCDGRETEMVYVMGERVKDVYVMRDMKRVCVMGEICEKEVCVMGERQKWFM